MPRSPMSAPMLGVLRAYWRSDRLRLVAVAAVVLLSSLVGIAAPYLFSRLIDRLGAAPPGGPLVLAFLGYGVLVGAGVALQRMASFLSFMSSENMSFIVGTSFFEQLTRKPPEFFVEHNPAQIQDALEKGRDGLTMVVQLGLIVFVPGIAQVALALVTLWAAIDLGIAIVVLVYGAAFIALAWFADRRTQPFLDAAIEGGQENARLVGNVIQAMEALRHFGAEGWARGWFDRQAGSIRDNWRAFSLRHAGFGALYGLALAVQFCVAFLLLLPQYRAGALSLGDLVLLNALLLQLNRPFEMIGQAIDDVVQARARMAPMAAIWAVPAEPDPGAGRALVLPEGRIVFEDVGFLHENGRGVGHASFVAERGRITFIVGETGAGKSTVLRLALKSLAPQRGRILVDGIDLATVGRAAWAARAAVVPQETILLNESIADNILLGRARDEGRLRRAAEDAAILAFVDGLSEGFATRVGERGLKLSGGERQRIAIARALYGAPAVLFLDEASSALDAATERDIVAHLRGLADRVTVVAVTHREGVIAEGDRVVRLRAGAPALPAPGAVVCAGA